MTDEQKSAFESIIFQSGMLEFHHGDCIGADDEAANIVAELRPRLRMCSAIIVHPPADETHQAFNEHYEERCVPKTHFARNRAIVDYTDLLIVCPMQMERQPRGGTWYTHDYAKKQGKRVVIVWPDGTTDGDADLSNGAKWP